MRITRVEIFRADLPMSSPMRIAIASTSVSRSVFVRVHTDAGSYGMGEANPLAAVVGETAETAFVAAQELAKVLIGTDPLHIEGRVGQMRLHLKQNATTRSAFDMALWDILGKTAGLPLYALLGGQRRSIVTDNTVYLDTAPEMARRAMGFHERGFAAIKVKLGTDPLEDVERVRAIRAAVGPSVALRVDANQGWSRLAARQALADLAQFGVQYCEQPVRAWDIEGLAELRRTSPIPIMADEALFDEHDALALVRASACDYFNIKLSKSSGIHVALKINAIAEAAGIACMVGCMAETRLGLTAAAHLASARRNIAFVDLDGAEAHQIDPVLGGIVYGAGGEITLPETPGIGADISAAYLDGLERVAIN